MKLSISYLERTYRFVFQPKDKSKFGGKRRFYVGSGQLQDYIGKTNAETVLRKAEEMKVDKKRLKFRETGILDIYLI